MSATIFQNKDYKNKQKVKDNIKYKIEDYLPSNIIKEYSNLDI